MGGDKPRPYGAELCWRGAIYIDVVARFILALWAGTSSAPTPLNCGEEVAYIICVVARFILASRANTSTILSFDIGIWNLAFSPYRSGEVHPRLAGGDKSRPYVIRLWLRRPMHNLCSGGVHLRLLGGDETDALSSKPDCGATL